MIRRVVQADGLPLKQVAPQVKQVIEVSTARTMMKLLEAVPQFGTAAQAGAVLKHPLGGKTGTTNSYTDAWFIGFSPSITCGTWIGFDDRKSLGDKETGAKAALPMWIDFMKVAIARTPVESFPRDDAPKKALDVNVENAPAAAPAKKPADTDDDGDDDSTPAAKTQAPAPAEPASSDPNAMPDDAPAGTPRAVPTSPRAATPLPTPPAPRGYVNTPVGPYRPYTAPAAREPAPIVRVPPATSQPR